MPIICVSVNIIISTIVQNEKADKSTLSNCIEAIKEIAKTLENSDLKKIVKETITIIENMRKSMQLNQTIQNIPKERKQKFFKNIQAEIDKMEQKMEKIREEEEEISEALVKLFDEPKQTYSGSKGVDAAVTATTTNAAVVAYIPKGQEPENSLVVGEHTAELVAAMTSDGNPGQKTPTIK